MRPVDSGDGVAVREISIHAPREGCDLTLDPNVSFNSGISIHAPREGCDLALGIPKGDKGISIHAPREGCDPVGQPVADLPGHFNPRTP